MVDIQSATAEIRRQKKKKERRKKEERKKKPWEENIMPHLLRRAAITREVSCSIISQQHVVSNIPNQSATNVFH